MNLYRIAIVLAFAAAAGTARAGTTVAPADRAEAAAAAFYSWCLSVSPNFEAEGRRATKATYQVVVDRNIPMPDGKMLRQKNWLVPDSTGTFMVTSEDITREGIHVTGCGIVMLDADGKETEHALSSVARLGKPEKRVAPSPGGGVSVWWDAREVLLAAKGDDQVMLAYGLSGQPGININLIDKQQASQ